MVNSLNSPLLNHFPLTINHPRILHFSPNMVWQIEIKHRPDVFDSFSDGTFKSIADLGIKSISKVHTIQVYLIEGKIDESQVQKICSELLADHITQEYRYTLNRNFLEKNTENLRVVEIAYHPGVMDPVEESTIKGIRDLGIESVKSVRTSKKYLLYGSVSRNDLEIIINKVLSNKLIQHVVTPFDSKGEAPLSSKDKFNLTVVDIAKLSDKDLLQLSQQGQLFLNLTEMKAI